MLFAGWLATPVTSERGDAAAKNAGTTTASKMAAATQQRRTGRTTIVGEHKRVITSFQPNEILDARDVNNVGIPALF